MNQDHALYLYSKDYVQSLYSKEDLENALGLFWSTCQLSEEMFGKMDFDHPVHGSSNRLMWSRSMIQSLAGLQDTARVEEIKKSLTLSSASRFDADRPQILDEQTVTEDYTGLYAKPTYPQVDSVYHVFEPNSLISRVLLAAFPYPDDWSISLIPKIMAAYRLGLSKDHRRTELHKYVKTFVNSIYGFFVSKDPYVFIRNEGRSFQAALKLFWHHHKALMSELEHIASDGITNAVMARSLPSVTLHSTAGAELAKIKDRLIEAEVDVSKLTCHFANERLNRHYEPIEL